MENKNKQIENALNEESAATELTFDELDQISGGAKSYPTDMVGISVGDSPRAR